MPLSIRCLAAATVAVSASVAFAEESPLRLSGIFSDHMVIQREQPVRVWGSTTAGDTVKVSLGDNSAEAKAEADGTWQAELPALKPGGPHTITVSDSDETTSVKDILVGDVWVCSGQSNMDWMLKKTDNADQAISQSQNNNIRLYKVARNKSLTPLKELEPPSQWQICSPGSVPEFSAVGYYFGRELQQELDVPIGLIHSAWGGTRAEWWTPTAGLRDVSYFADELKDIKAGVSDDDLKRRHNKAMKEWEQTVYKKDPGTEGNAWASPEFNDSNWKTVKLPWLLNGNGYADWDGTMWFRRKFTVSEEQAGKPLRVTFCADDSDATYINGTEVGKHDVPGKPRTHEIPAGVVKPGENTIAIRIMDVQNNGGVCGKPEDLKLIAGRGTAAEQISLAGEWKFFTGVSLETVPDRPKPATNIRPTVLYNAMIAPLVKFPIRGAIWYQGEGNARNYLAPFYAQTLKNMITQWRKAWGLGDFPFLQVQLASYMAIEKEPGDSDWALLREAQEDVLDLPATGMASAVDLGDEKNIHPTNKLDVGKRLALGALALAYGKDVEHLGPIYESHEIKGNEITLTFSHADDLKTSGTDLTGFAIAGEDGKFVWADARIDGNKVVVRSDNVPAPKAVRYGWANYSTGNLYNGAGLPASPFRTDRSVKD